MWHVYMDGNSSIAPDIFMQLYVIYVPLGDAVVSYVYALLPNKEQMSHKVVLRAIVDRCEDLGFTLDPSTVITNFENSAIKAVQAVLGPCVST